MNFYNSFLQSFYRDIQFVKPYADSEVLDHLWRCKVGTSSERNAVGTQSHTGRVDDRELARQGSSPNFHDTARNLCEHIYATIKAAAKNRQGKDGEIAGHVYTKLGKSAKGLTRDMERAPFRAKDTKNLINELEMLLTFVSANVAVPRNRGEAGGDQSRQMEEHYGEQKGQVGYNEEQGEPLDFVDEPRLR